MILLDLLIPNSRLLSLPWSLFTSFSLAEISPIRLTVSSDEITMVICPGIGNHSEKHYIRTFVDYAQKEGYRCAVLNHLGALPTIELTSPRIFTYGEANNCSH